jgi:hypothetical protein
MQAATLTKSTASAAAAEAAASTIYAVRQDHEAGLATFPRVIEHTAQTVSGRRPVHSGGGCSIGTKLSDLHVRPTSCVACLGDAPILQLTQQSPSLRGACSTTGSWVCAQVLQVLNAGKHQLHTASSKVCGRKSHVA